MIINDVVVGVVGDDVNTSNGNCDMMMMFLSS